MIRTAEKHEYKVILPMSDHDAKRIEHDLNELAEQGWRFVATLQNYFIILERVEGVLRVE